MVKDVRFKPHSINSRNHRVIKRVRRLRRKAFRDRERLFVLEGVTLVREAVESGGRLTELLYTDAREQEAALITSASAEPVQSFKVNDELMEWVSDVVTSQGLLGIAEHIDMPYGDLLSENISLLLVADRVRDPGNLGALIRTADASGVDGFILTPGCVDLYNAKVVRSAAGSHFHLPLVRGVELQSLKEDLTPLGMKVLALDPRGETAYLEADFSKPTALVVSNEAHGIAREDRDLLDGTVSIPMPGRTESLNAAAAAAVVLFEVLRQRSVAVGGA